MNFYPGPSAVHPQVRQYLQDAYDEGILSIQHRSERFVAISRSIQENLRGKLEIPEDYHVFYISSSTEGWHITNAAFGHLRGDHLYNGAFGEKWYRYREKQYPKRTVPHPYPIQQTPDWITLRTPELLHVTHNETSNATKVPGEVLQTLRKQFPDTLIAIDVASSLGGVRLDWSCGDVWLASAQKCLGLPAGLGLLVVSPKALAAARPTGTYNDLHFMAEKMADYQTTYTPNVLGIYLLSRVLTDCPPITKTDRRIRQQAADWYTFLEAQGYELLIQNPEVRSDTVIAVQDKPERIKTLKAEAQKAGFTLGNGYGKWKSTTFRIANFPAVPEEAIEALRDFLEVGERR